MADEPDYALAERLNAAQATFEAATDWAAIERTLREEAARRDVTYDPSDLEGIRRNAGYDVAHMGDPAKYAAAVQTSLYNAIGNYVEKSSNTPGAGDQNLDVPTAPGSPINPVPVASLVTTMAATPNGNTTPTVGPTGLAYQDDGVNYATMQQGARFGYSEGGALYSGNYTTGAGGAPAVAVAPAAQAADNTMIYVLIAGAAVIGYFLLKGK